ncbi:helix-turn-helix domain-containing protein [Streptomyces sp. NPDC002018]|uniref:helix-turn-helix domain-containing protein n=1 Tax=Streptomyces sp. NPDC002018 TaxID=3364629 RepID=UPI0036C645E6
MSEQLDLPWIPPGTRLSGSEADAFAKQVVAAYVLRGASIRAISEKTGRSYGAIHTVLSDANITLRSRGGQESDAEG